MASVETKRSPSPSKIGNEIDLRQLGRFLHNAVVNSGSETMAVAGLADLIQPLCHANLVVYFPEDSTGKLSAEPLTCRPRPVAAPHLEHLYRLALFAASESTVQIAKLDSESDAVVVAAPVLRHGKPTECLVMALDHGPETGKLLPVVIQNMQLLAASMGHWRGKLNSLDAEASLQTLSEWNTLLVHAAAADSLDEYCRRISTGLRNSLHVDNVFIGLRNNRNHCVLRGVSSATNFDKQAEFVRMCESLMDEYLFRIENEAEDEFRELCDPEAFQRLQVALRTHFLDAQPLRNAKQQLVGVCIVANEAPFTSDYAAKFHEYAAQAGTQIDLFQASRPSPLRRYWQKFCQANVRQRRVVLGIAAAIATILLVPVPARITCDCTVEPEVGRIVSATLSSRVIEILVKHGEHVTKGQVLAVMDTSELESDWAAALQRRVTARAKAGSSLPGERKAGQAELELAEIQIAEYQRQIDNATLRSPITGVIMSDDIRHLQGSMIELGKPLLEVGSADGMRVEVAIDDEDVHYAQEGRDVYIKVPSLPGTTIRGKLQRIHGRSEKQRDENVFVGEVVLDDTANQLRPGLAGKAKIDGPRRPLAWTLFRKAVSQLLYRLGW
ncbi:MAG: efflux RND transporter periplasmic adaptor subunit [Pirellulaceae bacterium]